MIIDAIYSGLLRGRLDQRFAWFDVDWVTGRDLRLNGAIVANTESVINGADGTDDAVRTSLRVWRDTVGNVIHLLDERVRQVRQSDAQAAQSRADQTRMVQDVADHILKTGGSAGGGGRKGKEAIDSGLYISPGRALHRGGVTMGGDEMDLDVPETSTKQTRKRTRI